MDYGHLSTLQPSPRQFRSAVRSFQDLTGLPPSGRLDELVWAQMRQARCGNADVAGGSERRKRFGECPPSLSTCPQCTSRAGRTA